MGDKDTAEDTSRPATAPSPSAPEGKGRKNRKNRKSGILAHLPPVPEPVDVHVRGLSPKKAFYGWLLIVTAILVAGITLNYVMTDGQWVASDPQIRNPDAALGDTPVQFLTANPYDILTTVFFTASIILLGASLFIRPTTTGRIGPFGPLAAGTGALAALSLALAYFGPHMVNILPWVATLAEGNTLVIAAGILGTAAVVILLAGLHRAGMRHETRALGWLVFAAHWALTGMTYYMTGGGDWVNMAFAYAAVFLLGYFAYQEIVSKSLGEDNPSLRFTAAAVVLAAGVWYAFMRIEILSQVLIETVTVHTVWYLELLNHNVQVGQDGQTGFMSAISYSDSMFPRTVIIILACTAIQSMMIFVAAALAVKKPGTGHTRVFEKQMGFNGTVKAALFLVPSLLVLAGGYWLLAGTSMSMLAQVVSAAFISIPVIALWGVYIHGKPLSLTARRILVVAVTVPIVYVLNLTRNAGIIIMWADAWLERTWPGVVSTFQGYSGGDASGAAFNIAHNWIGKGGSLLALVVIAFIVFKILPEVLRALVGLLDLPRRRGPLEQYWRELRGHKDKASRTEAPETA